MPEFIRLHKNKISPPPTWGGEPNFSTENDIRNTRLQLYPGTIREMIEWNGHTIGLKMMRFSEET